MILLVASTECTEAIYPSMKRCCIVKKCKEVLNEIDLHILIHTMPYEIDQLEVLLTQFKHSSKYLTGDDVVLVDVVLNNNLIDWENSSFPKEYFTDKFTNNLFSA